MYGMRKTTIVSVFVLAVLFGAICPVRGASKEKTLTIAMGSDLLTFDTQNHLNTSTNAILNNMTNQLFRKDANAEVHP